MKKESGLGWYQRVYKFLKSNECYLIRTTTNEQKLSLIDAINSGKGGRGIRLKVVNKKYGLYISRGQKGESAVVIKDAAIEYCLKTGLDFDFQLKHEKIIRITAELFKEWREIKNINVHRGTKVPKDMPYKEQLQSVPWKKFRQLVFKKRGRACEMCGAKKNLQIHHPNYVYGRKAWEYSVDDVVVLCNNCHKKLHNIK